MNLTVRDGKIHFPQPLTRATILRRPNRFVIDVALDRQDLAEGDTKPVPCHCPTTGRIGNLVLDGLPCLLSAHDGTARKTQHTVEAVSVDTPDTDEPSWIGINQNAANRYVEQALLAGMLTDLLNVRKLERERTLGQSRLDFLVNDDTYVEVKTPLQHLQVTLGPHVQTRRTTPLQATDRLTRHMTELGHSLPTGRRAILLMCFLYDNPGFRSEPSAHHDQVHAQVTDALTNGVEIWQVNFRLDPDGVRVTDHYDLTPGFLVNTSDESPRSPEPTR